MAARRGPESTCLVLPACALPPGALPGLPFTPRTTVVVRLFPDGFVETWELQEPADPGWDGLIRYYAPL